MKCLLIQQPYNRINMSVQTKCCIHAFQTLTRFFNRRQISTCLVAELTDVSVHHPGTVLAHCLQIVDLALQERHLAFQVLLLSQKQRVKKPREALGLTKK